MKRLFSLLPLLFVACWVGGCDSNDNIDENDVANATFTFTISGDVSQTVEGTATFAGGINGDGSQGFGFGFSGGTVGASTGEAFSLLKNTQDRPGNGTYQVGDATEGIDFLNAEEDEFYGLMVLSETNQAITAATVSGTIRVTDSDQNRIRGSVNFTATGNAINTSTGASTPVTVNISGTFTAVGGTYSGLPGKADQ